MNICIEYMHIDIIYKYTECMCVYISHDVCVCVCVCVYKPFHEPCKGVPTSADLLAFFFLTHTCISEL